MILLDKREYYKVKDPLLDVQINNLFARAVVENHVEGKVYVDDPENPTTFYVHHEYGMSLLFGKSDNQTFNESFRKYALNEHKGRINQEWMQAYPDQWDSVLSDLFGNKLVQQSENKEQKTDIIELNTRVNFKFNLEKFREHQSKYPSNGLNILRSGKEVYHEMKGSVIPFYFWESAEDFIKYGAGFSLYHENNLACTAYSAFVIDDMLELGIETLPEFRGKGFAQHTCAALIDYCINNDYEPIWACRKSNVGSYKLAQKIGFMPSIEIPYYKLSI